MKCLHLGKNKSRNRKSKMSSRSWSNMCRTSCSLQISLRYSSAVLFLPLSSADICCVCARMVYEMLASPLFSWQFWYYPALVQLLKHTKNREEDVDDLTSRHTKSALALALASERERQTERETERDRERERERRNEAKTYLKIVILDVRPNTLHGLGPRNLCDPKKLLQSRWYSRYSRERTCGGLRRRWTRCCRHSSSCSSLFFPSFCLSVSLC